MPVFGKIVVIRRNGMDGSMFPLIYDQCIFGRSTDCDIRVQLPNVKDNQCILEKTTDGRFQLRNLFEDGATKVNQELQNSTSVLRHKDTFSIFDRSFRIEYPPGSGLDHVVRKSFGTPARKTPLKEATNDAQVPNKSMDPFESLVMEMKISVKNKPAAAGSTKQVKTTTPKQIKRRESGRKKSSSKNEIQSNTENTPPESERKIVEDVEEKKRTPILFKTTKPKTRHSLGAAGNKNDKKKSRGRASIAKIVTHVTEPEPVVEMPPTPTETMTDAEIIKEVIVDTEVEMAEIPATDETDPSVGVTSETETAEKPSPDIKAETEIVENTCTDIVVQTEATEKKPLPVFKNSKPKQRHSISSVTPNTSVKNVKGKQRKSIAVIKYNNDSAYKKYQEESTQETSEPKEVAAAVEEEVSTGTKIETSKKLVVFEVNKPDQRHSLDSSAPAKKTPKRRKSVAEIKCQKTTPKAKFEEVPESPEIVESDSSLVETMPVTTTSQLPEEKPGTNVYEFTEVESPISVTSIIKSIKKNRRRSSGNSSVGRQRALHSFGSPIVLSTASPLRKSIGDLRRKSQPLQEESFEGDSADDSLVEVIEVENGTSPCKVTRNQNSIRRASLRKRVSFGPVLSPEEYIKTLPTNTPVKKGSEPRRSTRGSLFTPGNLPTLEEGDSPTVSSTSSTPKAHNMSPKVAVLDFKSPGEENTFKSPLTPVPKPKKKPRTPTPFRLSTSKMKGQSLLQQVLHASIPVFNAEELSGSADVGASPTFSKKGVSVTNRASPKAVSPASPKLPSKRPATPESARKSKAIKMDPSPAVKRDSPAVKRDSPAVKQNSPAVSRKSPAVKRRSVHKTFANRQNGKRPLWSDVVKRSKKTKAENAKKAAQKNTKVALRQQKLLSPKTATPETRQRHVDSPATVYIGRKRSRIMPTRTPKANRYGLPQSIEAPLNESFTGMADMMKTPVQSANDKVVKKMLSTPTIIRPRSAKKATPVKDHFGTKRLLKTPRNKVVAKPVEEHFGTKRLMRTPKQPKPQDTDKTGDAAVLQGVKIMVKTPKVKGKPVIENFGTKRLLKTPRAKKATAPANDAGLKAVSKLLKTPKEYKKSVRQANKKTKTKNGPVTEHFGTKRLLQTPKDRSNKSAVDESAINDVRHVVRTPHVKNPAVEEHFGTKRLMQTPKDRRGIKRKSVDLSGLQHMFKHAKTKHDSVKDHFGTKRMFMSPKTKTRAASIDGDFHIDSLYPEPLIQSDKEESITEQEEETENIVEIISVEPILITSPVRETKVKHTRRAKKGTKSVPTRRTRRNQIIEAEESSEVVREQVAEKEVDKSTTRSTRNKTSAEKSVATVSKRTTQTKKTTIEAPAVLVEEVVQEDMPVAVVKAPSLERIPEEDEPKDVESVPNAVTKKGRKNTKKVAPSKVDKPAPRSTRNTRGAPKVSEPVVEDAPQKGGRQTRRNKAPEASATEAVFEPAVEEVLELKASGKKTRHSVTEEVVEDVPQVKTKKGGRQTRRNNTPEQVNKVVSVAKKLTRTKKAVPEVSKDELPTVGRSTRRTKVDEVLKTELKEQEIPKTIETEPVQQTQPEKSQPQKKSRKNTRGKPAAVEEVSKSVEEVPKAEEVKTFVPAVEEVAKPKRKTRNCVESVEKKAVVDEPKPSRSTRGKKAAGVKVPGDDTGVKTTRSTRGKAQTEPKAEVSKTRTKRKADDSEIAMSAKKSKTTASEKTDEEIKTTTRSSERKTKTVRFDVKTVVKTETKKSVPKRATRSSGRLK